MKTKKYTAFCLLLCISALLLSACQSPKSNKEEFSSINTVCQLATLKCYYHNVAKHEKEADGFFKFLGNIGYKKLWVEYSGIVEVGIDVSKVKVSPANEKGIVSVSIPPAEILNVNFDTNSITIPITETGFLTSISADETTKAFGFSQEKMKTVASEDKALLDRARNRAKKIIEGYIKNVGETVGKNYSVEWINLEEKQ